MGKRAALGGLALLLAALAWGVVPAGAMERAVMTAFGTPYKITNHGGTVTVTALATTGGNNREFFWSEKSPVEADSTVCATFASGQGLDQQGVVLRLTHKAGAFTAISVTRNVWVSAFDDFNFHVWNTDVPAGQEPYTQFGNTVIPALPFAPATYPLNLCARTTDGTVQFIVWTAGMAQPAWGDPTWGGEALLPADAPVSGRGGFYAGHVVPNTSDTYTNLTVDGVTPYGL